MATCPLARILTRSDAECEREQCQWWVNFEGGNCWVVVTLMALHSYLYMKMTAAPPSLDAPAPPSPDAPAPPGPEGLAGKHGIDLERFRIDTERFKL
jgi:hypothetical protein